MRCYVEGYGIKGVYMGGWRGVWERGKEWKGSFCGWSSWDLGLCSRWLLWRVRVGEGNDAACEKNKREGACAEVGLLCLLVLHLTQSSILNYAGFAHPVPLSFLSAFILLLSSIHWPTRDCLCRYIYICIHAVT